MVMQNTCNSLFINELRCVLFVDLWSDLHVYICDIPGVLLLNFWKIFYSCKLLKNSALILMI